MQKMIYSHIVVKLGPEKIFNQIKASADKIVFVSPCLSKGLLVINRAVGEIVDGGIEGLVDYKNDLEFDFFIKRDFLWLSMGRVQEFTLEVEIKDNMKKIKVGEFKPGAFFPKRYNVLSQEDIDEAWKFIGPTIRELKALHKRSA